MFIKPLLESKNRFGVGEENVLMDEYAADGSVATPRELSEGMPVEEPSTRISGIFARVDNGS